MFCVVLFNIPAPLKEKERRSVMLVNGVVIGGDVRNGLAMRPSIHLVCARCEKCQPPLGNLANLFCKIKKFKKEPLLSASCISIRRRQAIF